MSAYAGLETEQLWNLLFKSVKLHPGKRRKNDNKAEKEDECFSRRKICVFRKRMGGVDEQSDDKIYEIAEHIIKDTGVLY